MKKVVFVLMLLSFSFCFAKENSILVSSEPVEYKTVTAASENERRKASITYGELSEDLDYLLYFLKTAYIGYEDLVKNGFDEIQFREHFEELYKNQTEIDTYDLYKNLADYLRPFPEDTHFSVMGSQGKEFEDLFKESKVYFSNIFAEKKENTFLVCQSDDETIKTGSTYTGNEDNLFYYPVKGNNVYRLGILSKTKIEKAVFSFENSEKVVTVSADKEFPRLNLVKYHEIETDDSGYVSLSSFLQPGLKSPYRKGADIVFEKFANLGIKWRNKKNIIVDLRSNLGGRNYYGTAFVYSFLTSKKNVNLVKDEKTIDKWKENTITGKMNLESPAYFQNVIQFLEAHGEQATYYYKNDCNKLKLQKEKPELKIYKSEKYNFGKIKSNFEGKLIILVDKNSASAGEDLIFLAKKLLGNEKVTVIGENTFGCLTYVDVLKYLLPNSHLSIQLGAQKILLFQHYSNGRVKELVFIRITGL